MEYMTLANGVKMPMLGFGTFQIDPVKTAEAVATAIEVGYRSIDTAQGYFNEEGVGEGIAKSGIARDQLFLTTKVWISNAGEEKAAKSIDESLKKLHTDYIDLLLIHQNFGDVYGTYRAMEAAYKAGNRLVDLCMNVRVRPAVNQVECHPFYQKERDLDVMREFGVTPMAWAPFAEGGHDIWNHPVLKGIAAKHNKTVAQVVLRWNLQRGVIVIPKTVHAARMAENINVFDFALDDSDMEAIKPLDTGRTEIFDHYDIELVKLCNTIGR